jgi:tetratricopeptide (TPR) repeat protein
VAEGDARVMTMHQNQLGAASRESGRTPWQIRSAWLLSAALLAGLVVSPAASNVAAQQGETRPPVEQKAASADDDPQQMAHFQDLIQEEKFAEAEPLLQSYLAAHPGSWKAYYLLGYAQFRQRRISASVTALAKSLELNVDYAPAHKLLGREFGVIGRTDMAMREFQEALRIEPKAADAHYNVARIYAMEDDFPKARVELDKAVRLDPDYMEAYNALGFAMEALGEDAASLQDYQTAIRLNEERHGRFDPPYVNLSGYYNRRGKLDLALEYAHKALDLNPQSDLAYFQIAKTCRTRGDWAGEAAALEEAISIRPASQYYYVLAIAYRKLGKIKESEQALATFQHLQKETADLEGQRREARRAEHGLELRPTE